MKKFLLCATLFALCFSFSCKKKIDQKIEDIIVNVMVDGEWIVASFEEGPVDQTAMFAGWRCKFNPDKSCVATNGSVVVNGTWNGSTATQSIWGNFPPNSEPVARMNGTWRVMKSNLVRGEFQQERNNVIYKMVLEKK